tara:strand:- start:293 stop:1645 length:1353 start_codon:yes stop_codon:yes gene_type:complete
MHTVHQHWDKLKVCAVGRSFPPEFYSCVENPKVRGALEKIAIETEEDFQTLISKLEEFDVEVLRTDVSKNPEDHNIGMKNPDESFNPGMAWSAPPMCPRDHTTMIGNRFFMPSPKYGDNIDVENIFNGLLDKNLFQRDNSREKILAKYLTDLMLPGRPISPTLALMKLRSKKGLLGEDKEVFRPEKTKCFTRYLAGVDAEEVKKLIFAAETNTIGSVNKFPSNKKFYQFASIEKWCKENDVPIVYDAYINGAMSWRIGKDIFFNYVNLVNKLNENVYKDKWAKLFPDYRVHAVDTPGHGDGGMHPVLPGLIIALRDMSFYEKYYPNWEVVYLPDQSWNGMPGFREAKLKNRGRWWIKGEEDNQELVDFIDSWLNHWVTYVEETVFDVNMLVIDKKNVIVNGYNKVVFDAFERYGITPHIVNFRHRYFWDGGLHCITSDISREGEQQDYHL